MSRAVSLAMTSLPTLVFVGADVIADLRAALVATTVTALLVLGWRLRSRQQVPQALLGASLAVVCAAVAAGTGQARGFFLLPMLLPAAATVVCLASVLGGRPLAGLVGNRLVGGPRDWRSNRPLHRFYARTTLVIALVSGASLVAQVALYRHAAIAWLGAFHILLATLWAGVTAGSIVLSRLAVGRHAPAKRAPSAPAGSSLGRG
jgi:ABC-type sugar transport system permease subunit